MIPIPASRVWIATDDTEVRCGMQTQALMIQEKFKRDPHAGDLFIFRGRRCDLCKIPWHDGVGTSLYAKRLDRGKFIWPSAASGVAPIIAAEMAYMFEDLEWKNLQQTKRPRTSG
jgi:transposase